MSRLPGLAGGPGGKRAGSLLGRRRAPGPIPDPWPGVPGASRPSRQSWLYGQRLCFSGT